MSALADGGENRRTARDEETRYTTNGPWRYAMFPVRWDADGDVTALAIEAANSETGALSFSIGGQPGGTNGCACRSCAPHEQSGPLPGQWPWAIAHTRSPGDRCTAITRDKRRCMNAAEDLSDLCATHRYHVARRAGDVT
jgi:hypothetical protein